MKKETVNMDIIEGQHFPRLGITGCYLCGEQRESRLISVNYGMNAMVAECPGCRIAFQSPLPSREASLAYMNWRWRSSDSYVRNRRNQMRRAMTQVGLIKKYMHGPLSLLDFGAGAGSFVRAALNQGWEATGIEQSSSARKRAKEFYDVELLEKPGEEKYDVITMWDVVEHLRDPREVLVKVGEHLKKDGLIFIETANFESWRRIADKDKWRMYLFDHQFYFTPGSLKQVMLEAGYNGFCLLNWNHKRPRIFSRRTLSYPLRVIPSFVEWKRAMVKWPGHGDIEVMVVVGRKESGPIVILSS